MMKWLLCLWLLLVFAPAAYSSSELSCEVVAEVADPHPVWPWAAKELATSRGSGILIERGWVVTASHVVRNAESIRIRLRDPRAEGAPVEAHLAVLIADSSALDLALLRIDEMAEADWPTMRFTAGLPPVGAELHAEGFADGQSASVPIGSVQAVQFGRYYHNAFAMQIQTSTPALKGMSGGPVLDSDNSLIGSLLGGIGVGRSLVTPGENIQLFLDDARDGVVDGLWHIPDKMQPLEGSSAREWANAPTGGVLVTEPYAMVCQGSTGLQFGDVLVSVQGHPIDSFGSITWNDGVKCHWLRAVALSADPDGRVALEIIRDGRRQAVNIQAMRGDCQLFPFEEDSASPFLVVGPYVFANATRPMAEYFVKDNLSYLVSAKAGILFNSGDLRRSVDERAIALIGFSGAPSQPPAARLRMGAIVQTVNGLPVLNTTDCYRTCRAEIAAGAAHLVLRFVDLDTPVLIVETARLNAESTQTQEMLVDSGREFLVVK